MSRIDRVESLLRQEIAKILQDRLRDELGFISVTVVRVTKDLSLAKVYYSQLGSDEDREVSFELLKKKAKWIKGELGRVIRLKKIPNLRFYYDDSLSQGDQILQNLDAISE
tara:strand:+ start:380 stop:712 length:333 start_codon:yes stop_codon:yes gene_type:complete